jgi:hypothetical protein
MAPKTGIVPVCLGFKLTQDTMYSENVVIILTKKEHELIVHTLSNVTVELCALGDLVKSLLMDPEDMEKFTPEGIKLLIAGICEKIEEVIGFKRNQQS